MSTAYQDPAADHGTNQWTGSGGPPPVPTGHWDCVNDGVRSPATNGDGYLLYVAGTTQNLREEFTLTASPSGVGTVTAIKVWGRGYRTQGSGSNVDIQADVYVAGGWLGAKALGMGGSAGYGSASWSGSWTKAQADAAIVAYIAGGSPSYNSYYDLDWGYVELTYSAGVTNYAMTVDPGAFALTSIGIGLRADRRMPIGVTTFSETSIGVGLRADRRMVIAPATFALTSEPVGLCRAYRMLVDATTFALTSVGVGLRAARQMLTAPVAFVLTSIGVDLVKTGPVGALAVDGYTIRAGGLTVDIQFDNTVFAGELTVTGDDLTVS